MTQERCEAGLYGKRCVLPKGHWEMHRAENLPEETTTTADQDLSDVARYDDLGRQLAYAVFRSNVDWATAARSCGDPKCHGDCRYIREVRRLVAELDGGILPAPEGD